MIEKKSDTIPKTKGTRSSFNMKHKVPTDPHFGELIYVSPENSKTKSVLPHIIF